MKKVVRTVWISLLSGLAFLMACTSQKGLTRAEKKQLKAERKALVEQIATQSGYASEVPQTMFNFRHEELVLRQRLEEIDLLLGDQVAVAENSKRMGIIRSELDSLENVIKSPDIIEPCVYGPPPVDNPFYMDEKEQTRRELMNRLDVVRETLKRREGACVYGSPEVIQRYREETNRLRQEAAAIEKQLEELDNE